MTMLDKDLISKIFIYELNNLFNLSEEIYYMDIIIEKKGLFRYNSNIGKINICFISYFKNKLLFFYNDKFKKEIPLKLKYEIIFNIEDILNILFKNFRIEIKKIDKDVYLSYITNNLNYLGKLKSLEIINNDIIFYFEGGNNLKRKLPIANEKILNLFKKLFTDEIIIRRKNYAKI